MLFRSHVRRGDEEDGAVLANNDREADTERDGGAQRRWGRGIEPLGAGGRPDRLGDERLGRRGSAKAVACLRRGGRRC